MANVISSIVTEVDDGEVSSILFVLYSVPLDKEAMNAHIVEAGYSRRIETAHDVDPATYKGVAKIINRCGLWSKGIGQPVYVVSKIYELRF